MRQSLAVVHNNIDSRSSIGAIAAWQVREALERGWDVTAVCRDLDPELAGVITHRPLYVPPRLHLLQWSVARPTVRRALRGTRPDVLLVHQPQLAAIADVWNVHYLSRAARTATPLRRPGWRGAIQDRQAQAVALLEDRYLRRVPARTRVLFCSDGLRDDFTALYGELPNSGVLYNPVLAPFTAPRGPLPDRARSAALTGGHSGSVVGFLGGGDPRKGGDLLVAAIAADPDLFLLHAGPTPLADSAARGRARSMGHLLDVSDLLDVVDALVVPSRFEPFALVVLEAAARGVPVIVGARVGSADLVRRCDAGAVWSGGPLGPIVRDLIERRAAVSQGSHALVAALDPARIADQLFAELDAAARRRGLPTAAA